MIKNNFLLIIFIILFVPDLFAQNNYLQIGQIPPSISFTSADSDKPVEYKKNKLKNTVYLIDFWATWCAPCIESIPHIDSLIEHFNKSSVKFISITYEPADLVNKFLEKHQLKSEIGIDTDFTMFKIFNGWAIPNIVMINSKGKFAGRVHPNKLNAQIIDELIRGKIPVVKNTPENLFDPIQAEQYFRSFLEKKKK